MAEAALTSRKACVSAIAERAAGFTRQLNLLRRQGRNATVTGLMARRAMNANCSMQLPQMSEELDRIARTMLRRRVVDHHARAQRAVTYCAEASEWSAVRVRAIRIADVIAEKSVSLANLSGVVRQSVHKVLGHRLNRVCALEPMIGGHGARLRQAGTTTFVSKSRDAAIRLDNAKSLTAAANRMPLPHLQSLRQRGGLLVKRAQAIAQGSEAMVRVNARQRFHVIRQASMEWEVNIQNCGNDLRSFRGRVLESRHAAIVAMQARIIGVRALVATAKQKTKGLNLPDVKAEVTRAVGASNSRVLTEVSRDSADASLLQAPVQKTGKTGGLFASVKDVINDKLAFRPAPTAASSAATSVTGKPGRANENDPSTNGPLVAKFDELYAALPRRFWLPRETDLAHLRVAVRLLDVNVSLEKSGIKLTATDPSYLRIMTELARHSDGQTLLRGLAEAGGIVGSHGHETIVSVPPAGGYVIQPLERENSSEGPAPETQSVAPARQQQSVPAIGRTSQTPVRQPAQSRGPSVADTSSQRLPEKVGKPKATPQASKTAVSKPASPPPLDPSVLNDFRNKRGAGR